MFRVRHKEGKTFLDFSQVTICDAETAIKALNVCRIAGHRNSRIVGVNDHVREVLEILGVNLLVDVE